MKAFLRAGFWYKTKRPTGGDLDLSKLVRDVLASMKVPVYDPCCPTFDPTSSPVKYDTTLNALVYFNKTTGLWVAVP